jgi:hypothetical protein
MAGASRARRDVNQRQRHGHPCRTRSQASTQARLAQRPGDQHGHEKRRSVRAAARRRAATSVPSASACARSGHRGAALARTSGASPSGSPQAALSCRYSPAEGGVRGQRHGAAAAHGAADRALGRHGQPGVWCDSGASAVHQVCRSARTSMPSAPWPAAGSMVGGLEHVVRMRAQAQALEARRRPARWRRTGLRRACAGACPGCRAAARCFRSGRSALQQHHAAQAGGAHHRALRQRPATQCGDTKASRGSSRSITQARAKPSGSSIGTSLSECTAMSARPSSSATSSSLTNRPLPPTLLSCGPGSGRPWWSCPAARRCGRAAQQGLHMLGLPQGQAAFAGGDDDLAQSRNLFVIFGGTRC